MTPCHRARASCVHRRYEDAIAAYQMCLSLCPKQVCDVCSTLLSDVRVGCDCPRAALQMSTFSALAYTWHLSGDIERAIDYYHKVLYLCTRRRCRAVPYLSFCVPSCPVVSRRVPSCPVVSRRVPSCPVVSRRVPSCPVVSRRVLYTHLDAHLPSVGVEHRSRRYLLSTNASSRRQDVV